MATRKAKGKVVALRGEERIQQLMQEFPEVPRVLVIKCDLIREGVRPGPATRQAGKWALPDAHWYFEYDKEDTHTPEETAEGYTLSPVVCFLSQQVAWHTMFDSKSPYEIRYEERGRYRLYRDGDPLEEVFFPPRPQWYSQKTTSGKPMSSVIALRSEDFMFISALTYCEYGKDNLQCRYCNVNSSEPVKEGLGLDRLTAKRDQDIYETFLAGAHETDVRSLTVSGGVILDPSREADNYARIVRVLRRAMKEAGKEVPISVKCQALEAKDQMKVREAGASSMGFNLEVWDPKLFEIICPGKAKYVGRQRWIERMLQAVDIWGSTNTSLVLGVELAPPYGFKTEDEGAESMLAGFEWLLQHGITPGGSLWRPVPGTEFAGMSAPRTEYLLRTELARHKLLVEYNKAAKPGRPNSIGQAIYYDIPHVGLRQAPIATPNPGPARDVC